MWINKFYISLQEVSGEGVEIIFISSDRSPDDMVSYMKESHGEWFAIEHGSSVAQGLKQKFNVTGIPCLVVLKADGTLITKVNWIAYFLTPERALWGLNC